jgi:hypothetical protein
MLAIRLLVLILLGLVNLSPREVVDAAVVRLPMRTKRGCVFHRQTSNVTTCSLLSTRRLNPGTKLPKTESVQDRMENKEM